jgi:hypothetical protein
MIQSHQLPQRDVSSRDATIKMTYGVVSPPLASLLDSVPEQTHARRDVINKHIKTCTSNN